ncbi:response regulator [Vibrio fluvialis]|uniref:response regulator n=1 Tax=Vibrio fluvialis TaxID=676 RepID=UPI00192B02BE|nr:response regulator [Vibrio fluvialis]MBL4238630.1 response regulator [Vibrio fluvialis]MBL4264270.1 response regulator [Vibrio fluvialis]MBL4269302.1 response regulator [Vibrio fluvialis]MBL4273612.1 response regulator [Vibrio fluvialis]MBO1439125.1 response regulator [Vibrio fluvialis]
MRVLVVEDSNDKRNQIKNVLTQLSIDIDVNIEESVRGAIDRIDSNEKFDLILLDMSLPLFDITDEVPDGGEAESFGGHEIIEQMSFLKIYSPVIVITHYRTFQGGTTYEALEDALKCSYPDIVKGMIYYDHPSSAWKNKLIGYLNNFGS